MESWGVGVLLHRGLRKSGMSSKKNDVICDCYLTSLWLFWKYGQSSIKCWWCDACSAREVRFIPPVQFQHHRPFLKYARHIHASRRREIMNNISLCSHHYRTSNTFCTRFAKHDQLNYGIMSFTLFPIQFVVIMIFLNNKMIIMTIINNFNMSHS